MLSSCSSSGLISRSMNSSSSPRYCCRSSGRLKSTSSSPSAAREPGLPGPGQVAGVGDVELVDGHGADRGDDVVVTVIQRPVPDGRAQPGVVGAAQGGE